MVISQSYVNVYERVNPRSELGPIPSSTTNVATNAKNAEWAFVGALPNDPTLATLEHPTGPSQQYPENHSAKNPHRKWARWQLFVDLKKKHVEFLFTIKSEGNWINWRSLKPQILVLWLENGDSTSISRQIWHSIDWFKGKNRGNHFSLCT